MNLLAYNAKYQDGYLILTCSDEATLTTKDWAEACGFLLNHCDFAVVYDVDQFTEAVSKILPKAIATQLLAGGRVFYDRRKLYYQPGKLFGLNYINFYGLQRYTDSVVTDCQELIKVARQVIVAFKNLGITEITKLTSPIAVYGDKMAELLYPRAGDLPNDAMPLIKSCSEVMTREWRDTFQLGHWNSDQITDYDLSAAYPSIVANLPDITNAKFFFSDTMPDKFSWGELYGTLTIKRSISPFWCEQIGGYPVGTWDDKITTEQLWLINKYQLGTFELKHGDFFLLPEFYDYPFKQVMFELYKARNISPMTSKIAKGISVGIWGKFAERYEERLGDNFNSIYARMTTSRCLIKVADFIYRNQLENDVVSVLVDGVLATKRLNIAETKEFGKWRRNAPSPALVLSTNYQWLSDKRPAMLDYKEIMAMIQKNPKSCVYGDVDFNFIDRNREFDELPRNGGELIRKTYSSQPVEVS